MGGFCLLVELHWKGSAPAACPACFFSEAFPKLLLLFLNTNKSAMQAAGADPSRWSSTSRQIRPFSKIAVTFEPIQQFWCTSGFHYIKECYYFFELATWCAVWNLDFPRVVPSGKEFYKFITLVQNKDLCSMKGNWCHLESLGDNSSKDSSLIKKKH